MKAQKHKKIGGTIRNAILYHQIRKKAHKIIRKKKKLYIINVIESIEEDQKYNNIRKMYQTINPFKKGKQHKFNTIRNKKKENCQ